MNLPALVAIAVISLGALSSPLVLAWAGYCLTRPRRRAEGTSILGGGLLAAAALLIAGFLTAPPESPGLLRVQALIVVSGVFAIGGAAGKIFHLATYWWRNAGQRINRAA